jgi:glutamine synthetase
MTDSEIKSRFHINMEKYAKDIVIEANTLDNMISSMVLPAVYSFRKSLIESLVGQKTLGMDTNSSPEKSILDKVGSLATQLQRENANLRTAVNKLNSIVDEIEQADFASENVVAIMNTVRKLTDQLEDICPDSTWPYPKYMELLF